ncbi:hypothetical protein GPECTOR_52g40 [Gonium pectorale]|uniref:Protein kinase domain-containing protein n=1 Tax=Gonium pectorale TaxID=33097 RepID=A0A150G8F3_GONPE|nr:hypothetical protein GPECTOR_52g40 [Gonium pectorale]|eukprot:KXZ45640.1 hypothetical protein GPECTOR_52g40 [Gonium pectorale]
MEISLDEVVENKPSEGAPQGASDAGARVQGEDIASVINVLQDREILQAITEAAISKSLQHPNIVSTYSVEVVPLAVVDGAPSLSITGDAKELTQQAAESSIDDKPLLHVPADSVYKLYIIQEFCDVGSLRAALDAGILGNFATGGVAPLCALTLALDVACGMRHIHDNNIMHGDLSASVRI